MRLLNVKPHRNWKDTSVYHWRLGAHTYEDEGQMHDPFYHMLGEVERKHVEKLQTEEFRSGPEVRFVVGDKKPVFRNYRF